MIEHLATPADEVVSFTGLGHAYTSERWIFRQYTASVRRGTSFAILGPNGRGKSTLLHILLGLFKPSEGSVAVSCRPAFVPQLFHVSFDFSVLDMVLMGRARHIGLFGLPSRQDREAALAALDRFKLAHLATSAFHRLSGGERQLVIFARALVAEREILILDEPTSSLDLRNQMLVLGWIHRLVSEDHLTVIFTTHHPHHALAVADDTLLMTGEREFVCGPAEEVLTEERLQALYGVPLKRMTVESAGRAVETLVPILWPVGR